LSCDGILATADAFAAACASDLQHSPSPVNREKLIVDHSPLISSSGESPRDNKQGYTIRAS